MLDFKKIYIYFFYFSAELTSTLEDVLIWSSTGFCFPKSDES